MDKIEEWYVTVVGIGMLCGMCLGPIYYVYHDSMLGIYVFTLFLLMSVPYSVFKILKDIGDRYENK